MRRLIVMSLYCENGAIEIFKKLLIQTIKPYADFFCIVCNGNMSKKSIAYLKTQADYVMMRDNIGYDAGAYKDVLALVDLNQYEQLLLINDTFFGFFYSLDCFFECVNTNKNVDFGGFTKFPRGEFTSGKEIQEHIQSYFMLIGKKMLHSTDFKEFWKNIEYPQTHREAIEQFEIAFSTYFTERNYIGEAYCDLKEIGVSRYNMNPYMEYPYELIVDLKCPILKRKSVVIGNTSVWKALQYIRDNQLYDFDLLWNQVMQDYKNHSNGAYFNLYELEEFISKYSRIYIYGTGVYGKGMAEYLQFRGRTFEKYIVSTKEDVINTMVIEVSELDVDTEIGIIVALKNQYTKEVLPILIQKIQRKQLFLGNVE